MKTSATPHGQWRNPARAASRLAPYVPATLARFPDVGAHVVTGTMVSADVSGFTNLSEKLAAAGKEGAEQLTAFLNERFTRMITAAHQTGGDVLKFGGDAILVLWDGDEHERRATVAARAMREAVADPVVSDLAGEVQLRMSIGIHSGQHELFVVEAGHRELLVTGPGPTGCVAAESAADAGEILASPSTAANLPPAWLRPRDGGGPFAAIDPRAVADIPDEVPGRPAIPDGVASVALPTALRRRVAAGTRYGEHRMVSVAFLRFAGTDQLVERHGPDGLHQPLQRLAQTVAGATRRFGVHWLASDVAPDGGKIILTAGAPTSTGNDETAILRAVRDILDAEVPIDLHVGVNRGRVFVGDVGSPERRAFTVMGDPVNLAARLSGIAAQGQVVASLAAIARCKAVFDLEHLEPFRVKGKDQPVEAAVVGALLGADARYRGPAGPVQLPLIGREEELTTLLSARKLAEEGHGHVVELVGPSGAGKTRLLRELAVRSGSMRILAVNADLYLRSEAFSLVRPLVRQIMGLPPDTDADTAGTALMTFAEERCPDVLDLLPLAGAVLDADVPMTPEAERIHPNFRRARALDVIDRLARAALHDPTMFLIEDLHVADAASREVILKLARDLDQRPWLFCVTRQPDTARLDVDNSVVLEIEPLRRDATRKLIGHAAGRPLTPAQVDRILETADGNPLFALELSTFEPSEDESIPETIEALLVAQLDRLDAADRLLLSDLAVLGLQADYELVEEVVFEIRPPAPAQPGQETPSTRTWVSRAVDPDTWSGLLAFVDSQAEDGIEFRHHMVQRAAYAALAFSRRRDLHSRAADALSRRPNAPTSVVAQHYGYANRHAEAFTHAVHAAEVARRAWATEEALEMYRLATRSADHLDDIDELELMRVAESYGDLAVLGAQYREAIEAFDRGRAHAAEHFPAEMRLITKIGRQHEELGEYNAAVAKFRAALDAIDEHAGKAAELLRIDPLISWAGIHYRHGDYEQCVRMAEQAERDAIIAADNRALGHVAYLLLAAHGYLATDGVDHYAEVARQRVTGISDLWFRSRLWNNVGVAAYWLGRWDDAVNAYEQGGQSSRQAGNPQGEAIAQLNVGEILSDRGQTHEAVQLFEQARQTLLALNYPSGAGFALANLGRAEVRADRHRQGLDHLRQAVTEFDYLGAAAMVAETRARLAEGLLADGRHDEAITVAEGLLSADRVEPRLRPLLLRVCGAARQDPADRLPELTQSVREADETNSTYERAISRQALAAVLALANDPQATDVRREAQEILDQLGVLANASWDPTVRAAGRTSSTR